MKHKKKYLQCRQNIQALEGKVREFQFISERLRDKVDQLEQERDQARSDLRAVEWAIEDCVGQGAAVLGVKEIDGPIHGDVVHARRPRAGWPMGSILETVPIRDRIMHRLELQEVQEAIDICAFRLRHNGFQTKSKLSMSWFLSDRALKVRRVREQVAMDIAMGLVERLSGG